MVKDMKETNGFPSILVELVEKLAKTTRMQKLIFGGNIIYLILKNSTFVRI